LAGNSINSLTGKVWKVSPFIHIEGFPSGREFQVKKGVSPNLFPARIILGTIFGQGQGTGFNWEKAV